MKQERLLVFCEVLSAITASIAAAAAIASYYSAENSLRAAQQNSLQSQLSSYIEQYLEVVEKEPHSLWNSDRYEKSEQHVKARVRIVAGLLVGTIDAMHGLKDQRAETWRKFIASLPGPLCDREGFDLEVYSSTKYTQQAIGAYRASIDGCERHRQRSAR